MGLRWKRIRSRIKEIIYYKLRDTARERYTTKKKHGDANKNKQKKKKYKLPSACRRFYTLAVISLVSLDIILA